MASTRGSAVAGAAEPASGVDEDATSGRSGIRPPGSGDRQPEEPDVQVAIAGVSRPLGRVDDPGDALGVAEVGRVDHLLDPGRECALDGPAAAHRPRAAAARRARAGRARRRARPPTRRRRPRVRRVAELGRPPQRGDRHVKGAAAARAPPRLLELQGDVLVRSGDQCRAVPDPAVGLGLERLRERLVHAPALRHARALTHRRADQRMAEADRPQIELDDGRVGGRLEKVDVHRRSRRRRCLRAGPR